MSRWKRDIIYSIALLLFCAVHWVIADGFVQNVIKLPIAKPSAYAQLVLGVLALLSVAQLVRALVRRPAEALPLIFTKPAVITVVALVLYVATVRTLGFLLATFLLMSIFVISYRAGMGKLDTTDKKKLLLQLVACLLVALAITMVTGGIFRYALGAKLPKCKLF